MERRKYLNSFFKFSVFLLLLSFYSDSAYSYQARAFGWKYSLVTANCKDHDGNGTKSADIHSDKWVNAWEGVMDNHWSTTTIDTYIGAPEVTDEDRCTWGNDHTGDNLDNGDASFVATHGGGRDDYWKVRLSTDNGNGGSHNCESLSFDMKLGDNDLEFVHFNPCHSADQIFIDTDYNGRLDAIDDRLHQYGGMHGNFYGKDDWDDIADFAEEGFTSASSLAWSWLENLYTPNVSGSDDNCPLSVIQGTSSSDATARKNYEDYNPSQYPDPDGEHQKYHFYCDCNPDGEPALECD